MPDLLLLKILILAVTFGNNTNIVRRNSLKFQSFLFVVFFKIIYFRFSSGIFLRIGSKGVMIGYLAGCTLLAGIKTCDKNH